MRARRVADGSDQLQFRCAGCNTTHEVTDRTGGWSFNGNLAQPTFHPSVLVKSGHFRDAFKQGDSCWCTYDAEHPDAPSGFKCYRCHSFVRDGRIEYLGDCSHSLAGQTIDLPEFNE